ncbi:unnamed protein product [Trichobilharzia regenti]|nr:unnamed protein product [Trichobilharzia regenti]
MATGLLAFASKRVVSSYNLGKTVNDTTTKSMPRHHEDFKPNSSQKESGSNANAESDRPSFRSPFTWDPFGGFSSVKPTTSSVKFKVCCLFFLITCFKLTMLRFPLVSSANFCLLTEFLF